MMFNGIEYLVKVCYFAADVNSYYVFASPIDRSDFLAMHSDAQAVFSLDYYNRPASDTRSTNTDYLKCDMII